MPSRSNIRINKVFADSIYARYKQKRYGIKTCNALVDADFANDMRELLKRNEELQACSRKLEGCGLDRIQERIDTL